MNIIKPANGLITMYPTGQIDLVFEMKVRGPPALLLGLRDFLGCETKSRMVPLNWDGGHPTKEHPLFLLLMPTREDQMGRGERVQLLNSVAVKH